MVFSERPYKGNKENNKENPKGAFRLFSEGLMFKENLVEKNVHYLLISISI